MNKMIMAVIFMLTIALGSCDHSNKLDLSITNDSSKSLIFPKGEKIISDRFHGIAWLQSIIESDSTNHIAVGSVTFEPGARTNWHLHPDGQIIIATGGVGYYQEKGKTKKILVKGDVVKCPPDTPHWHGASYDSEFIQIAVTSRLKGPTEWFHAVSDEEYIAGEN